MLVLDSAIVIEHRNRQNFFSCVLTDYIIVEERTNLSRIRKLLKTGLCLFSVFFVNYLIAEIDALVTDINTGTGD